MDNRDLEAWGRRAAEWSVEYLESLRERPVRPGSRPGEVMEALPPAPTIFQKKGLPQASTFGITREKIQEARRRRPTCL